MLVGRLPDRRLGQYLPELFSEGGWNLVPVAGDLDEPLQVRLELVVICTGGTPLQVQLQLEDLRVVQLPVKEFVELVLTVAAIHCWGTSLVPLAWTIPDSTAYS